MSQTLPLTVAIQSTFAAIKQSEDYSDRKTIASFMALIYTLLEDPTEITTLSNPQLADLAVCMSCIQTSNFIKDFPQYYDWDTGRIISAVGFYAYMKQLDNSYLLNSHYPSFIVLVHIGRKFISDLFLNTIIAKENYSIFTSNRIEQRQNAENIAKYFEYMLHVICKKTGNSDFHTESWFNEIDSEIVLLKQRISGRKPLEDAKYMYRSLAKSFAGGIMPNYCKVD